MKIGVFDSGRGGTYIAEGLAKHLSDVEFVVINDSDNVPYGSRSNEEVTRLTDAAIQPLLISCPIIVIACHTATIACIATLRARYPKTQFIGIEPMIKPAASRSHTQHITVLGTPLTIASARYQELKKLYANGLCVDEPTCRHWAKCIENDREDDIDFSDVAASIRGDSDCIVLACTHYLKLIPRMQHQFPNVTILEPTQAIAERIVQLAK